MILIRHAFVFMAMVGLMQGPAGAYAAQETSRALEIKEVLELLPPDGKHETVSQLYDRLWVKIPIETRMDLAPYLEGKGHLRAAHVSVKSNRVTISENGQQLVIDLKEVDGKVVAAVNGKPLTDKQMSSTKALIKAFEKILKENEKKSTSALLWTMMVQDASAFGTIILVGVLALAAFMYFKNKKSSSAAPACTQQCCLVNNVYQVGCCATLGGLGAGSSTVAGNSPMCPVGCTPDKGATCYDNSNPAAQSSPPPAVSNGVR